MDDSRAEPPVRRPPIVPPYLLVLLLAAVAGIVLMHRAAATWEAASQAQTFPPEVRRSLVFAVLFNAGIGGALALAALGEIVASVIRLLRKAPVPRALAGALVAIVLLVLFLVGHRLANPWVGDIARALRGALG